MSQTLIFGYGSLVNAKTHAFSEVCTAELAGWRRVWKCASGRDVSFLTVESDPHSTLSGVIIAVSDAENAPLNSRESSYDRLSVTPFPALRDPVSLFRVPDGQHSAPSQTRPILQSYIDTVLQGYLARFGLKGVTDFLTSTSGWGGPIFDDRSNPRYPRAHALSPKEREAIRDAANAANLGVEIA